MDNNWIENLKKHKDDKPSRVPIQYHRNTVRIKLTKRDLKEKNYNHIDPSKSDADNQVQYNIQRHGDIVFKAQQEKV